MRLAEQLAIAPAERVDLYYAELLTDAGCTASTSQLAMLLLGDETIARQQFFYLPTLQIRWRFSIG
jgi:tryptophanase